MKADQSISKNEIRLTRLALQLAMKDVGETPTCDWLSSRQGKRPHGLKYVLGGPEYKPERKPQ